MTLAERLVHGLRTPATEDGDRLDSAVLETPEDALRWIENWWTADGGYVLRREMPETGKQGKRHAAEHWLFLRHLYRERIAERGGRS